jgi:hypothetical protein
MAFGITKKELNDWKQKVVRGEIAFLTHYWLHPRYPHINSVTKVGCADLNRLFQWGAAYGLNQERVHHREDFPHYDLIGGKQKEILYKEQLWPHIERFGI